MRKDGRVDLGKTFACRDICRPAIGLVNNKILQPNDSDTK